MKPSFPNGSVFLVPLRDGGFARGVIARAAPDGSLLLGYFFGPRLASQESADLSELEPSRAILSLRFGDLGLVKGLWHVFGRLPEWNPDEWPMPNYVRRDPLGRAKPTLVRYDDTDPSKIVSERAMEKDIDLPADGLAGHGFVEAKLTKLLG